MTVDKLAGNTIQIPTSNSDPETVRVRIPNLSSSSNNQKLIVDGELQKGSDTDGKFFGKLSTNTKSSNALNSKFTNTAVHRLSSNGNLQADTSVQNEGIKLQLYDKDLKVSFVSKNETFNQ